MTRKTTQNTADRAGIEHLLAFFDAHESELEPYAKVYRRDARNGTKVHFLKRWDIENLRDQDNPEEVLGTAGPGTYVLYLVRTKEHGATIAYKCDVNPPADPAAPLEPPPNPFANTFGPQAPAPAWGPAATPQTPVGELAAAMQLMRGDPTQSMASELAQIRTRLATLQDTLERTHRHIRDEVDPIRWRKELAATFADGVEHGKELAETEGNSGGAGIGEIAQLIGSFRPPAAPAPAQGPALDEQTIAAHATINAAARAVLRGWTVRLDARAMLESVAAIFGIDVGNAQQVAQAVNVLREHEDVAALVADPAAQDWLLSLLEPLTGGTDAAPL